MSYTLNVKSIEEFQILLKNRDVRISQAIVNGVLKHLKTKKKHIHVLEVNVDNYDDIVDITVDREDFDNVLKANLIILEETELYEECIKVKEAIVFLKL